MSPAWKVLCASVIGTSHEKRGDPCQDNSLVRVLDVNDEKCLVVACADGAGSCSLSHQGSHLACEEFIGIASDEICEAVGSGTELQNIFRTWIGRTRERIVREAILRGDVLRDFSCTLLVAIVGEKWSWFGQIGDGVIVVRKEGRLEYIFWPQSGEYVNTTNFLTADDFERQFVDHYETTKIEELAVLTDGLQPLALHYATRKVHEPFFNPMFQVVREWDLTTNLESSLRTFLASGAVNERTDDDKTLILASRVALDP